jgi:acyl-coenzyme A thioesterase PaaI-like protein
VGERLVAIGRAVSVGKSLGVSRAEVYAQRGKCFALVCVATTTCRPFELARA